MQKATGSGESLAGEPPLLVRGGLATLLMTDELAPLYVFLASDESRYISGEVIGATGGKPLH